MSDKMNFLIDVLKGNDAFKTLLKNDKTGKSLCVSGLTAVSKAYIIYSMCRVRNVTALCVASDEKEAQILCNDLCSMGVKALFYPVRDYNFIDIQSKSHE